eukprot:TRINITY_DN4445_c0_g3_i1.p1 TRINITY_DN4445_c0_g3~~TRINITY_DN4445_c0_g3_i1.p1  ORF type:complete len:2438 (+),score=701.53 TRINITY_DN4445_c0_g3_i1:98-7411(+)
MLTIKINIPAKSVTRALRFNKQMSVQEAINDIQEKTNEGGEDHGLFQPAGDKNAARWLVATKPLSAYDLVNDEELVYRKKTRMQKIATLDGTVRTVLVDDSKLVIDAVKVICERIGLKHHEEFAFKDQDRKWIKNSKTFLEQGLTEDCVLMIRKMLFFYDDQIDEDDAMQVHLLYLQIKDSMLNGEYPCQRDEAAMMAATQAQVELHDCPNLGTEKKKIKAMKKDLLKFLPPAFVKTKKIDEEILKNYQRLKGVDEKKAKFKYVQFGRALKTYGVTTFPATYKGGPIFLGVRKDSLLILDTITLATTKSFPLNFIKRFASTDTSVKLDFGGHADEMFTAISNQAREIVALISGYVDITTKNRKDTGFSADDPSVVTAEVDNLTNDMKKGAIFRNISKGVVVKKKHSVSHVVPEITRVSASQMRVESIGTALSACKALIEELNAAPSPYSREHVLSQQQWKQQFSSAYRAVVSNAGDILKSIGDGKHAIVRGVMVEQLKQLMLQAVDMGASAKNIFTEGNDRISLIDASRNLVSSLSGVLGVLDGVPDNGTPNAEQQAALLAAQEHYAAATALMEAILSGKGLVDKSSLDLILKCGKNLSLVAEGLLSTATTSEIEDVTEKRALESETKEVCKQAITVNNVAATMGGACLVPACRTRIASSADLLKGGVTRYAKSIGTKGNRISDALQKALLDQSRELANALSTLLLAVDSAEPLGDMDTELASNFAEAYAEVVASIDALRQSLGTERQQILNACKAVTTAVTKVVAKGKSIAANTKDAATRAKLEHDIKAMADMINSLYAAAKESAEKPQDKTLQEGLMRVADALVLAVNNLSASAGCLATGANLRHYSKELVTAALGLIAATKSSMSSIPASCADDMSRAIDTLSQAMLQLVGATHSSAKDPMSIMLQRALLQQAMKSCVAPMATIAALQRITPKIRSVQVKQGLILPAEEVKIAAQNLVKACQAYNSVSGQGAVDEAAEELSSLLAELQSLEAAVVGDALEINSDRHASEDAMALLQLAIDKCKGEAQDLTAAAKDNPRMLGPRVKSATESTAEAVNAARAVISTTADKPQRVRLVSSSKTLALGMKGLLAAANNMATTPGPETSSALNLALANVLKTLDNFYSAQQSLQELDDLVDNIRRQAAELKPETPPPGMTIQKATEHLANCANALGASVTQLATTVHTNPAGLYQSALQAAALVPGLLAAAAAAAGASPKAGAQVIDAARRLVDRFVTTVAEAKKRIQSGIMAGSSTLLDAVKGVSDSIAKLLHSLGAVSNRDFEDAMEMISGAIRDLSSSASVAKVPTAIAIKELGAITKALLEHTSAVLARAKTDPTSLGTHALGAAEKVKQAVDVARAIAFSGSSEPRVPQPFIAPSQQIAKAVQAVSTMTPQTTPDVGAVVAVAKNVHAATTQLLAVAKQTASTSTQQQAAEIDKAMNQLRTATATFARSAKAAASGEIHPSNMYAPLRELQTATNALLDASKSVPSADGPSEKRDQVLASARDLGVKTSNLISSSMAVSAKPQDKSLQVGLTANGLAVSDSIRKINLVASGMIEGAPQVEAAITSLEKILSDLSAASMAVVVGGITDNPSKTPHTKLQEELVRESKRVINAIGEVEGAARLTTGAVAKVVSDYADSVQRVGLLAIEAASTTQDAELQSVLVNSAKALAESSLKLAQDAFACACIPSKEALDAVANDSRGASQSVGQLVSKLSASSYLLQDLEEALKLINKAVESLEQKKTPVAGASYQAAKDEIAGSCRAIASGAHALMSADKTNLVQMGSTAKAVAGVCVALVPAAQACAALAAEPAISRVISDSAAAIVYAMQTILQATQALALDPNDVLAQGRMAEAFKECTMAITELLQAAKKGAIGELMCEAAATSIGDAITKLDSAAMFASAGQLEVDGQQRPTTPADANRCATALRAAASDLVAACGAGPAGADAERRLGSAAKKAAVDACNTASVAIDAAGRTRDMALQQEIVGNAKAACLAAQSLVLAGKDAQQTRQLETIRAMATELGVCLDQFEHETIAALGSSGRGAQAVDNARAAVTNMLGRYGSLAGNSDATAVSVVSDAKNLVAASAALGSGLTSGDHDEIARAAAFVSGAATNLLQDAVGAHAQLPSAPATNKRLDDAVTAAAKCVQSLLATASARVAGEGAATKTAFDDASAALLKSLHVVGDVIKQYPGGEHLSIEEEQKEAEDLETIAENELTRCARVIQEAAAKLLAARPVSTRPAGVRLDAADINAIILEGAHAICLACGDLVGNAAVSQSQRTQTLRSGGAKYRADPTWSNGLISAAQKVVRVVQELIGAANKPTPVEEELIATARAVAASTAHLVTASRVKAENPDSADQRSLQSSSKAVVRATVKLVGDARKALAPAEEEAQQAAAPVNFVQARNREYEMQIEVQRLEEKLRKTRTDMLRSRQSVYQNKQ